MNNVLIVEGEPGLLKLAERTVSTLPDASVRACPTAEQALSYLVEEPVDLAIVDLNLPGMSGLELIADARARQPELQVIVTTGMRRRYAGDLAQLSSLEILEKPYALDELEALARQALCESQPAPNAPFSLTDYLQLAVMGRRHLAITAELESGERARIEIVDGNVWNCWLGKLTGLDALEAATAGRLVSIDIQPLEISPVERQLEEPTVLRLLRLAQDLDNRIQKAKAEAPFAQGTNGTRGAGFTRFEAQFESAMEAYLRRDYETASTLLESCAQPRPQGKRTRHNLSLVARRFGEA